MNGISPPPYRILLIDNDPDWTRIHAVHLRREGYEVHESNSVPDAQRLLAASIFDIVAIDIDLGSRETGDQVARDLRENGFLQPIILVTGQEEQMSREIGEFASILALGPTHFWFKNDENTSLIEVVFRATRGVDPIRRSLLLMKEAGFGDAEFRINDIVYTVNDLLRVGEPVAGVLAELRQSLMALIVESSFGGDGSVQ